MEPQSGALASLYRAPRLLGVPAAAKGGQELVNTKLMASYASSASQNERLFVDGSKLPERFAKARRFVIGELGFGAGINFVNAWKCWKEHAPPTAQLWYFAWENEPLTNGQWHLAHEIYTTDRKLAKELAGRLPPRWPGWHVVELDHNVRLMLAYEDAAALFDARFAADVWFLDGFPPASNPAMWEAGLLAEVFRASAPDATACASTSSGHVLRSLAEAGFEVQRLPGKGLRAHGPGRHLKLEQPKPRVAVVGAGIAGASSANALLRLGADVQVFEQDARSQGASSCPAVMLTPRVTAGHTSLGELAVAAYSNALRQDAFSSSLVGEGALLAAIEQGEQTRQQSLANFAWPGDLIEHVDSSAASELAGAKLECSALWIALARQLDAQKALSGLLAAVEARYGVGQVEVSRAGQGELWQLSSQEGELGEFTHVVHASSNLKMAMGPGSKKLGLGHYDGVVSCIAASEQSARLRVPLMFGGSLLPANYCGDHLCTAVEPLPAQLARALGLDGSKGEVLWRGRRHTTSDRHPVAGELEPGLFVLGALGSKGFSFAGLLAQLLAARVMDAPQPLAQRLALAVSPNCDRSIWSEPA